MVKFHTLSCNAPFIYYLLLCTLWMLKAFHVDYRVKPLNNQQNLIYLIYIFCTLFLHFNGCFLPSASSLPSFTSQLCLHSLVHHCYLIYWLSGGKKVTSHQGKMPLYFSQPAKKRQIHSAPALIYNIVKKSPTRWQTVFKVSIIVKMKMTDAFSDVTLQRTRWHSKEQRTLGYVPCFYHLWIKGPTL